MSIKKSKQCTRTNNSACTHIVQRSILTTANSVSSVHWINVSQKPSFSVEIELPCLQLRHGRFLICIFDHFIRYTDWSIKSKLLQVKAFWLNVKNNYTNNYALAFWWISKSHSTEIQSYIKGRFCLQDYAQHVS